jgi:sugar phosphate isomerase/epimerase
MQRIIICDDDNFDVLLPLCLSNNLGIELQSFWDPRHPESYPAKLEYQLSKISQIDFRSFHGPFGDLNCGSYDPMIQDVTMQRMILGYDTAAKLKATHIVFHHGYVPGTSPIKNWVPRFTEFYKVFLFDKQENIYFHLENMLELSPEVIIDSIDTVNNCHLDACLDLGHAHCNSKTPVLKWIETLGKRIGYVHLHDNNGKADEHNRIGAGTIPFKEVCDALDEYSPNAIWALETKSDSIEKSLDWLKDNGYLSKQSLRASNPSL